MAKISRMFRRAASVSMMMRPIGRPFRTSVALVAPLGFAGCEGLACAVGDAVVRGRAVGDDVVVGVGRIGVSVAVTRIATMG